MNHALRSILSPIMQQLLQTSTWRGIIGVASSAGLVVSPEHAAYIVAAGWGASGLIAMFFPDVIAKGPAA